MIAALKLSDIPKVDCIARQYNSNPAQTGMDTPVKCLICESFLDPVSCKMSLADIPWSSSTVCVSKTERPLGAKPGLPPDVLVGSAAAVAGEREIKRRAAADGARAMLRRRIWEASMVTDPGQSVDGGGKSRWTRRG